MPLASFEKDKDRDPSGQKVADPRRDAEQGLKAQRASPHIPDIKDKPSQNDQKGDEVAKAGQKPVCDVLSSESADAEHSPDVNLGDRRKQDR